MFQKEHELRSTICYTNYKANDSVQDLCVDLKAIDELWKILKPLTLCHLPPHSGVCLDSKLRGEVASRSLLTPSLPSKKERESPRGKG